MSHDGVVWDRQRTRAADLLLGYLALNGQRRHPREKLAALIWGESSIERARGVFKTTLWRLRGCLEPDGVARGTYLDTGSSGEVGLNWQSDVRCDAHAFLAAVQPALQQGQDHGLPDAVALYGGDLLDGFYDGWVLSERQRLHELNARAMMLMMRQAVEAGRWADAVPLGDAILADDPLRESVHREMIRCHLQLGDRAAALRQYGQCAALLRAELDVEPMAETRALYPGILADAAPAALADMAGDIASAFREVESAVRRLAAAQARLGHRLRGVPDHPAS